MIYLPCKHDIISVPSYAAGIYHPLEADIISKIYHPFREERISCKKPPGKSLEAFLARRKGLEPPTYWFVASHSIQLS